MTSFARVFSGGLAMVRRARLALVVAACLLALAAGAVRAEDPISLSAQSLKKTALDLQSSMADALQTASTQRDQLKADMEQARRGGRALDSELAAYRILLSTYGNLALVPQVSPEALAKALTEQRQSLALVRTTISQLASRREDLSQQRLQTEQQLALNQTQQAELRKIGAHAAADAQWLEQLAAVIRVQKEKLGLIERLDALHAAQAEPLQTMEKDLTGLGQTLSSALDQARRSAVLTRGESPLSRLDRAGLAAEAERLRLLGMRLHDPDYWRAQLQVVPQLSLGRIATFLLLACGLLLVLLRLRAASRRRVQAIDGSRWPWRAALLTMVQRAVVPVGLLAFLHTYLAVQAGEAASPLSDAVIAFFWVWLPGNWLRVLFGLPLPMADRAPWQALGHAGRRLVRLSRLYAAARIFLVWTLGAASMLAALVQLAFEVALVLWLAAFWRRWRRSGTAAAAVSGPRAWILQSAAAASYFVVLAATVLDLAGYGALAFYWYRGWGLTLVAALWSALVLLSLWEVERGTAPGAVPEADQKAAARLPVHWATLRLAWLGWALALAAFLALAWGGWQSLESGLGRVLNYPFQLGDMTLRLSGALVGLLLLFFTHLAVRLWRHMLQRRVLAQSGMTTGARDSITTISSYLLWAVGILMALHAFGISTTSLTVAFGALGIGLGFGLQNIFNNFISGLILLFERPIQVGDDIEINGTWAKVTRINVRSTVVQTYDNASLIIPNSDFISNQVTNWSHKDPHLRRSINVGVAYGSDTQLVRRTLLEVAAAMPRVLRHPAPDVLFSDFGDSALNFRLRIWTDIDHMLTVETAIRFEIDRLFRERGIEIAFPQQDIHIRSIQDVLPIVDGPAPAGTAMGPEAADDEPR